MWTLLPFLALQTYGDDTDSVHFVDVMSGANDADFVHSVDVMTNGADDADSTSEAKDDDNRPYFRCREETNTLDYSIFY